MMECQFKFKSLNVWNYFTTTFAHMPIAALLNDSYFLVHGGLSPEFELLEELEKVDRYAKQIQGALRRRNNSRSNVVGPRG